jgi:1,4-alpha-glucan branching enzyme
MSSGSLALVLHAHLPFVRHPEHEEFLEEDWLFEAITETYLPLIAMMERLNRDGVPFQLTMTITPTLCAMLQDQLLRDRYVRYLDRSIDLAGREMERNRNDEPLRRLSEFYHANFSRSRLHFQECTGDLLNEFRKLRDTGCLEIMATSATHGLLPLLQESREAVRAQVQIGRDIYRSAFGTDPTGFWLPECAYAPGLETILQEANLRWFIVDAQGLMFGQPRPRQAIYAPCYTAAGPAVFARDRDSSRQVWSASEGYPGDPAYRDFYRDIGFDLPLEYIWPGSKPPAVRKFTGLKYHRITGRNCEKELYDPVEADRAALAHASHFLEVRRQQINEFRALNFDPLVVAPFDAELFGHWWFEGPRFLESFIRKAATPHQDLRLTRKVGASQPDFQLTTPTAFLAGHSTQQKIAPAASSWGENGYLGVWLDPNNSWIYPHLHAAARLMTEAARAHFSDGRVLTDRVLKQLARELLLAQSSDWAFLMKTGTARNYATKRVTDHLLRFNRLHEQFTSGRVDEDFLSNCEWRDNLFPDLNWRYYLPC